MKSTEGNPPTLLSAKSTKRGLSWKQHANSSHIEQRWDQAVTHIDTLQLPPTEGDRQSVWRKTGSVKGHCNTRLHCTSQPLPLYYCKEFLNWTTFSSGTYISTMSQRGVKFFNGFVKVDVTHKKCVLPWLSSLFARRQAHQDGCSLEPRFVIFSNEWEWGEKWEPTEQWRVTIMNLFPTGWWESGTNTPSSRGRHGDHYGGAACLKALPKGGSTAARRVLFSSSVRESLWKAPQTLDLTASLGAVAQTFHQCHFSLVTGQDDGHCVPWADGVYVRMEVAVLNGYTYKPPYFPSNPRLFVGWLSITCRA